MWAVKDVDTPGEETQNVVECWVHPRAQSGFPTSCDDLADTYGYDGRFDLAVLRVASPFTTVAPRSLAPPRTCLGDPEGAPGLVRGFAHSSVRRRLRGTMHASGYRLKLELHSGNTIEDGDSGGTLEEALEGGPVLGALHGKTFDAALGVNVAHGPFLWSTPLSPEPSPHDWLWTVLDPAGNCSLGSTEPCVLVGASTPLHDADSDGLPDVRDLCPTQAPAAVCDGQHCDSDGDWVGDECDDHPGICNHDDPDRDGIPSPVDPCPMLHASDTSSSDIDGDGTPDDCDACVWADDSTVDWGVDSDMDGAPDGCDNCPIANPSQANCNLDMEILGEELIRGDACDPNPCPSADPVPSDAIETISSTEFALTNRRIEGRGVAIDDAQGTMRTGFRFCPCDTEENTVGARRQCSSTFECTQRIIEYADPYSAWKPMSIGWLAQTTYPVSYPGGGTYHEIVAPYATPDTPMYCGEPPAVCSNLFDGDWDFFADGTATGALVTETWGARLRAVVWSRGVSYAPADDEMIPFGCNLSSCPPLDGELNSHYWSGEARWKRGFRRPWPAPPSDFLEVAALPAQICPLCDRALPLPYFLRECAIGSPCLRYAGPGDPRAVDEAVGSRVDAVLQAKMKTGSLRWIAAGEAPELLREDATRLVAYDATSRWIHLSAVAGSTELRAYEAVQGLADAETDAQGAGILLSGNRHLVFALGGLVNGQPLGSLRSVSLADGASEAQPIEGPLLENVRAAALHASGRQAAVLHQVGGGPLRVVWVDLGEAVTLTLSDDHWPQLYDQHELGSLADGGYALLAWSSWWPTYRLLVFDLGPNGLVERSRIEGSEEVLGGLHGSAAGVSFLVQDPEGGAAPVGHQLEELEPAFDGDIYGMF